MPAQLLNVYVVGTNERAALAFLTDAVGGGLMWPFFRPLASFAQTNFLREDKSARFYRKGFPPVTAMVAPDT
jgi:hypothetical protein